MSICGRPTAAAALLVAIINEHNELAEYLLEHGADPNLADDKGRAALYVAIDMRDLEWSTRPAPPEKDKVDGLQVIKALLAAWGESECAADEEDSAARAAFVRRALGESDWGHAVLARGAIG